MRDQEDSQNDSLQELRLPLEDPETVARYEQDFIKKQEKKDSPVSSVSTYDFNTGVWSDM